MGRSYTRPKAATISRAAMEAEVGCRWEVDILNQETTVLAHATVEMIAAFSNLGNKEEAKVQIEKEALVLPWSGCPGQGYPLRDGREGSEH